MYASRFPAPHEPSKEAPESQNLAMGNCSLETLPGIPVPWYIFMHGIPCVIQPYLKSAHIFALASDKDIAAATPPSSSVAPTGDASTSNGDSLMGDMKSKEAIF